MDLHGVPEKIAIDKSGANTAAIKSIQTACGADLEMRQIKYLNNIVEQDHRAIKRVVRPMLEFKTFRCARALIAGTLTMHMIRKGQFDASEGQASSAASCAGLLPATPAGRCLPELAAILPEPLRFHAQWPCRTGPQDAQATADGSSPSTLARTAGLPATRAGLTPPEGCTADPSQIATQDRHIAEIYGSLAFACVTRKWPKLNHASSSTDWTGSKFGIRNRGVVLECGQHHAGLDATWQPADARHGQRHWDGACEDLAARPPFRRQRKGGGGHGARRSGSKGSCG